MKNLRHFIIIDDDPINNMICSMVIEHTLETAEVISYTNADEGFNHIMNRKKDLATILFLDINMPEMSGWEFLEKFETLDESLKTNFSIYLLSSSVNMEDKSLAVGNPYVKGFISKPLKKETILEIKNGS